MRYFRIVLRQNICKTPCQAKNIFATEYGFEGECPLVGMVSVRVRRGVNAVTVEGPMTLHTTIPAQPAPAIFSDLSSLQHEEYPMTTHATT